MLGSGPTAERTGVTGGERRRGSRAVFSSGWVRATAGKEAIDGSDDGEEEAEEEDDDTPSLTH